MFRKSGNDLTKNIGEGLIKGLGNLSGSTTDKKNHSGSGRSFDKKIDKKEKNRQEDEKKRQELIKKQKIVNDKAKQEGDRIHDLAVKSAKATEVGVQVIKDIGSIIKNETITAFTDPAGLEEKRKERSADFWKNTKQTVKTAWEKEKTSILSGTKNFYDDAEKYLQYKKENQNKPYSYMGFDSYEKQNSYGYMDNKFGTLQPTDENINILNDLSKQTGILLDTQKMIAVKEMEIQYAMADDWKRNKTMVGRFGIDLWGGLVESGVRPTEGIRNWLINTASYSAASLTGMPQLGYVVSMALSGEDNVYSANTEAKMYSDRELTPEEKMKVRAMGYVMDLGMSLANAGIRKGFSIENSRNNISQISPSDESGKFYTTANKFIYDSKTPKLEPDYLGQYISYNIDKKTGIYGDFDQRRFYRAVEQGNITKTNYDINLDPTFKINGNNFEADGLIKTIGGNTKNINPDSYPMMKVLQSVPENYEISNKAGVPYVGTNKMKQYFNEKIGIPTKQKIVEGLMPTVRAIEMDRQNPNLIIKGINKIKEKWTGEKPDYSTGVNQSLTHRKIGNSLISKYDNMYKITELDFLNTLHQTYDGQLTNYKDFIKLYESDPRLFSKIYLDTDYNFRGDTKVYKMIDKVREGTDTTIRFDKSWNTAVDPEVIKNHPKLFTSNGVDEREAFKLFLKNFEGIEKSELKQIKSIYDFSDVAYEFDGLLKRAGKELGMPADWTNLDLIKQLETARKKMGRELFYDIENNKLTWVESKKDNKLFNLGRNKKNPDYLKVSELIEKYMKAPSEQYTNNSFKYITPENQQMGRVEAVFHKDKFFEKSRLIMDKDGNLINSEMFRTDILPFAEETFNLREGATPLEIYEKYKDLNNTIHETTKISHLKGASTELGDILPVFRNFDSMVTFFDNLDLFYSNEEFMLNVINKNHRRQAEYMTFGKPAQTFKNDITFNLFKDAEYNKKIGYSDIYQDSANAMVKKISTAIDNTIIGNAGNLNESNWGTGITRLGIDAANTKYLGFTGLGEVWTNRGLSDLRAFEYRSGVGKLTGSLDILKTPFDTLKTVGYGTDMVSKALNDIRFTEDAARFFGEIGKNIFGEKKLLKMSEGDQMIIYSALNDTFNQYMPEKGIKGLRNNLNDFLLTFQNSSEIQKHFQDRVGTNKAIFDLVDRDYSKISNSTKNLMTINGIGETEFNAMKPLIKEFKNNGIIKPTLLFDMELNGNRAAGDLFALHNNLFYEINTLNKGNAYIEKGFYNNFQAASSKLFKGTTQGLNFDILNKLYTYEAKDGAIKNRFMYAEGWASTAKYSPALFPVLATYGLMNKTGRLQNMILTGRQEAMQEVSKYLAEEKVKIQKIIDSENILELGGNVLLYLGSNALNTLVDGAEAFIPTDLIGLFSSDIQKVADEYTNQESIDRGENKENTLKKGIEYALSFITSNKGINIAKRSGKYGVEWFRELTGQDQLPKDISFLERIKDPDERAWALNYYRNATGAMKDNNEKGKAFKLLEPLVGTWEALKATKASLTPSERSMFYKELEKMAQDKEKVDEFTTSVLGYIDNENKKEYQLRIEDHLNYLADKVMRGEISDAEFEKLTREIIDGSNLVIDSEFNLLNRKYAELGKYIINYRNLQGADKQLFKEEFLNIINEAQGRDIKPTDDKIINVLDHFVPENEQNNFFDFVEEQKNKPKQESKKEDKKAIGSENNGRGKAVEVFGGGPNYTEIIYENGEVWRIHGDRAARNNNPGNMDSSSWQKNYNGLGTDKTGSYVNGYVKKGGMKEDRNAVFATYEDGVKAYKHLVFERDSYKNKTIRSVMYAYAPPEENNTEWYIQQAMKGIPGEYKNVKMKDWPEKFRDKLMENMFKVEGTGKITKEEKIGAVEK